MSKEYTVKIQKLERLDPRLGRNVRHDSRSLRYLVQPRKQEDLVSIRHKSYIPVLDQGQIGSCTGNAATKCLSYEPFWSGNGEAPITGVGHAMIKPSAVLSTTDTSFNQAFAVSVYSDATKIDPWEGVYLPTDTGSDGLSVAKVVHSRGLISGYEHATSLNAVLTALQKAPVLIGTEWRRTMSSPYPDGRMDITGPNDGGHEYLLDEVDMENKRVWIQNSWGPSWGIEGRAWLSFDDLETLLHAYGDATVFVPNTEAPPTPSEPAEVDTSNDPDVILASEAKVWLAKRPFFYRKTVQKWLKTWIETKQL